MRGSNRATVPNQGCKRETAMRRYVLCVSVCVRDWCRGRDVERLHAEYVKIENEFVYLGGIHGQK